MESIRLSSRSRRMISAIEDHFICMKYYIYQFMNIYDFVSDLWLGGNAVEG